MRSYKPILHEAIKNLRHKKVDYKDYNHIPTVRHRKIINKICENLPSIGEINLFCLAIALNNKKIFFTLNDPDFAIVYTSSGIHRADNYFNNIIKIMQPHVFPREHYHSFDPLQNYVTCLLEQDFNIYNSYCLVRTCDDCTILISVAHTFPIDNVKLLYENTVNKIEDLAIYYMNILMSVYTDNLPGLKHSRFAMDKKYRMNVIKNRRIHKNCYSISAREIECLYWASRGKTADEIAAIMQISEHTVNEHKKAILRKLQASNITHAVREAIKHGFII